VALPIEEKTFGKPSEFRKPILNFRKEKPGFVKDMFKSQITLN
jgi:hypothetical protein